MKRIVGFAISFIEEFFFVGFVFAIISFFALDATLSDLLHGLTSFDSFKAVLFGFMFLSLFLYPVFVVISVIAEKTGFLYEGEYSDNSVLYNFFFTIWNDIIFPIYALMNFGEAPVAVLLSILLWLAEVGAYVIGLFIM
ncbi:MAG: hypothetical protein IKN95_10515 [Lachnospiraceae bacterium]|nr:hypothetical protein [Lachnospiraceae bacterium]